jgi:hypothetical protein
MKTNILTVFLIAIILFLLLPIMSQYYCSEQAFTIDNLIRVNQPAK